MAELLRCHCHFNLLQAFSNRSSSLRHTTDTCKIIGITLTRLSCVLIALEQALKYASYLHGTPTNDGGYSPFSDVLILSCQSHRSNRRTINREWIIYLNGKNNQNNLQHFFKKKILRTLLYILIITGDITLGDNFGGGGYQLGLSNVFLPYTVYDKNS